MVQKEAELRRVAKSKKHMLYLLFGCFIFTTSPWYIPKARGKNTRKNDNSIKETITRTERNNNRNEENHHGKFQNVRRFGGRVTCPDDRLEALVYQQMHDFSKVDHGGVQVTQSEDTSFPEPIQKARPPKEKKTLKPCFFLGGMNNVLDVWCRCPPRCGMMNSWDAVFGGVFQLTAWEINDFLVTFHECKCWMGLAR